MSRSSSFINDRTRLAIYFRDWFTCVYCGKVEGDFIEDSVVTLSLDHVGDRDDHAPSNLVTACVDCNSHKRDLSIYAFCKLIGVGHTVVYRRIRTQTSKPIQGYRDCVGVLLSRGLPYWLGKGRWLSDWGDNSIREADIEPNL